MPVHVKRDGSDDESPADMSPSSTSALPGPTPTNTSPYPADLSSNDDASNDDASNDNASNDDVTNNDTSKDDTSKDDTSKDNGSNKDGSNSDATYAGTSPDDAITEEKVKSTENTGSNDNTSMKENKSTNAKEAANLKGNTSLKKAASSKNTVGPLKGASFKGPSKGSKGSNPVIRASFTSNPKCSQTVSCNAGTSNEHTGVQGIGAAAVNHMLFGGPPGVYDGSAGYTNVNGLGGACGSCWTLTPDFNYYPSNGKPLGKTVVVRINDACTDPGYCDQTPEHPLNTGPLENIQPSRKFKAPVHFDLCEATDVAEAFFGEIKTGVAIGFAQYNPDCNGLEDGNFGAKTVSELAKPS
ncbi:MAG: hypothetical protein Q9221_001381 [Calogaya cf. arnoldii]